MSKRILNEKLEPTFTGIWIPKNIWLCDELTPTQMFVLMQIHSLDGPFGCKASNEHLAEFFGVHKNTMSEHIQNLLQKDFISVNYKNDDPSLGNRIIKCTRKFKLMTAGLIDEIQNYTETVKSQGQGNTEGGKGNTDERLTLEEHKIFNLKTPIIIPNTTVDLRNNLSTLCSILRINQEDLQPNQMMKVKKLVTINFDLLIIYLKQIPLQLDNPVATLGSNLDTLLKILDIITQPNFRDLSEQELEGLFEFIDKRDNLDFYLQQALTENNKPSKIKRTIFLLTYSLMSKALTIKENYNIASIVNNEKKVEIDYSSFFEIK